MVRVKRPSKVLAVDFDGVIHAYNNEPSPGTLDALRKLSARYRLVVFTARHDLDAVRAWLHENRMDHFFDDVTNRKPAAYRYIDDKALCFVSWDQTLDALRD